MKIEFTEQELAILLELLANASAKTASGKITLGNVQTKVENAIKELRKD